MPSFGMLVVASIIASSVCLGSLSSSIALSQRIRGAYAGYSYQQRMMLASYYAMHYSYNPGFMAMLDEAMRMDGLQVMAGRGAVFVDAPGVGRVLIPVGIAGQSN